MKQILTMSLPLWRILETLMDPTFPMMHLGNVSPEIQVNAEMFDAPHLRFVTQAGCYTSAASDNPDDIRQHSDDVTRVVLLSQNEEFSQTEQRLHTYIQPTEVKSVKTSLNFPLRAELGSHLQNKFSTPDAFVHVRTLSFVFVMT